MVFVPEIVLQGLTACPSNQLDFDLMPSSLGTVFKKEKKNQIIAIAPSCIEITSQNFSYIDTKICLFSG